MSASSFARAWRQTFSVCRQLRAPLSAKLRGGGKPGNSLACSHIQHARERSLRL